MDIFVDPAPVRERCHGLIVGLDVASARLVPGVVAVLTRADVPGTNRQGIVSKDQPVLCGKRVRHCGDPVALVVAETREALVEGLARIHIVLEPLPGVFDAEQALLPDAPLVHPGREGGNLLAHGLMEKGDARAEFQRCAVVVGGRFATPMQPARQTRAATSTVSLGRRSYSGPASRRTAMAAAVYTLKNRPGSAMPAHPVLQYRWALRESRDGKVLVYHGLRNPPHHQEAVLPVPDGLAEALARLDGSQSLDSLTVAVRASEDFRRLVAQGIVVDRQDQRQPSTAEHKQTCTRCVADDHLLPGLEFDARGVCAFCQCYEQAEQAGGSAGPRNAVDDAALLSIAKGNKDSRFDVMAVPKCRFTAAASPASTRRTSLRLVSEQS